MRGLSGRSIIVVAGAGTIGSRVCHRLGAEGANVAVTDLDLGAAETIAASIVARGGTAVARALDVTDEGSVVDAIRFVADRFGGIDGAHINVADLSPEVLAGDSDVASIDLGLLDHILAVDLKGPVICTRHLLPHLLARGGGPLLYTSSAGAYLGGERMVGYAMAKSGLNALVRHVASAYGKQGIRANAIAPGLVLADNRRERDPAVIQRLLDRTLSDRLGEADDIAAMAAMLLSDDSAWLNGQIVSVDGGMILRP